MKIIKDPIIIKFIEKIEKCAPLNCHQITKQELIENNIEPVSKYPYKPALIIAIFYNRNDNEIFNQDINLNDDKIIKTYYNILMSSPSLCYYFKNQLSKNEWYLGYNDKNKKMILNNMFENPVDKLQIVNSDFWTYDKNKKTIRINYDTKLYQSQELKDLFLSKALNKLKDIVPEYKELSLEEIIDYENFIFQSEIHTLNENDLLSNVKIRRYQHIFAKIIKDRDKKCLVCNLSCPQVLEACHIKPHNKCCSNIEKYDCNNGLTMCANHHSLFDAGMFSFDEQWNLILSPYLNNFEYDSNILFNQDNVNKKLPMIKSFGNPYLKYHNEKVFRK